jgi:hypothetical protein
MCTIKCVPSFFFQFRFIHHINAFANAFDEALKKKNKMDYSLIMSRGLKGGTKHGVGESEIWGKKEPRGNRMQKI